MTDSGLKFFSSADWNSVNFGFCYYILKSSLMAGPGRYPSKTGFQDITKSTKKHEKTRISLEKKRKNTNLSTKNRVSTFWAHTGFWFRIFDSQLNSIGWLFWFVWSRIGQIFSWIDWFGLFEWFYWLFWFYWFYWALLNPWVWTFLVTPVRLASCQANQFKKASMFSRETQIGFFSRETLECLFFWCFSGEVLVFFVFFLDFLVFFLKPVFDGYRPEPAMRLILST